MCQANDDAHRTCRAMTVVLALTVFLIATWLTGIRAQTTDSGTPASEPAPAAPTATDVPTAEPTATDVPTAEPTATEAPTAALTATDVPTAPTATGVPTALPTAINVATQALPAANAASPTANSTPTATTVVSLQVHQSNTNFGQVSASGELDPTMSGLTSTVDAGGAYYVRTMAIELTVSANGS